MATLELTYDQGQTYDLLWSWDPIAHVQDDTHLIACTVKQLSRNVHVAQVGPKGTNPTQNFVIKSARGRHIPALTKEAELYTTKLRPLQGSVVPTFHGFYKGKVDGFDFACMILEHCVTCVDLSSYDQNRNIMVAVCKLHQVGVLHQQLDDGHHILSTPYGIRIVDFSVATRYHMCQGAPPLLTNDNAPTRNACPELVLMEKIYGTLDLLPPYGGIPRVKTPRGFTGRG